jgi:hypothetical protein
MFFHLARCAIAIVFLADTAWLRQQSFKTAGRGLRAFVDYGLLHVERNVHDRLRLYRSPIL